MRKINYGLIVSDFDGTLVKEDGTISEATKTSINEYIQNGGVFAISTGRLPQGIVPQAEELGLNGLISCGNGSIIWDLPSRKPIFQRAIPNAIAVKVCEKMEKMGLHIHVYDEWEYYCNMDDDALKSYERITKTKGNLVLDKLLSQFLKETGMDVYKLLAMVLPEDNASVRAELEKEEFEHCIVTKSSSFLVEVLGDSCSKGTAVEFLANHYGIAIEKTIGIGDQCNDIPMLETAGLGIAVKNADEELQKRVFTYGYTNEEGAVGKIIEEFGYTEE
ncbi:MAG: HAD family phosphatase [Clostridia bacterium]|nr:HAD family phosphatase [Clostridia bacterium]